MAKRIVFTGKQALQVEEFTPARTLEAGQVRVRGLCSIISTGTENIVYNRLFDPGTHWDHWVKYPFYPGYSFVGQVAEVGAGVKKVQAGQRVALRQGHAQEQVVPEADCIPVPDGIRDEDAVWFALSKITFAGAKAAQYKLGCTVAVIGGGPIGQLTARWALCCGASQVALLDPLPARLELARRGGVTVCIGKGLPEGQEELEAALGGKPEVVLDTTGAAPVFPLALNACAPGGTVVMMGDTGSPGKQCLTPAVITGGLHIVGAHDMHVTHEEALSAFWPLVKDGRFQLDGLITHHFTLDQAPQAYEIANARRGETMGMLFDLTK